jgi:hypothetical protein
LVLAVATAAGLALPGSGGALPAGAQKWLGTWETNFGKVQIFRVYRKKSDYPDVNGKPQYYWAVEGGWTTKEGTSRTIAAALIDRNGFDTLEGCWKPSPEPTNCARILMFRKDDRITGGYWKNCRDYCKSHHPFKGERKHGVWLLGWRFRQRGKPEGGAEKTQSGGAGSLMSSNRRFDDNNEALDGSGVFHVDAEQQRVDIRIDRGNLFTSSVSTVALEIEGVVTRSESAECPVGAEVQVILADERTGRPDRITFIGQSSAREDPGQPDCRIKQRWISTDPDRVSIHIGVARESGR